MSAMVCAIYARKSNEQEMGATGNTESVERQIEHATEYIARKGWTLGPGYSDDTVSGATYAKLHERNRMLADAEVGKFQVLVVAEQQRLGRDLIESCYSIKLIAESGVKIYSYLDDSEISVEDEVQQAMTMLRGFAGASERRQTSKRVYDAALQRAKGGFVAGAKTYGYDNIEVDTPHGLRKKLHINPEQAAVLVIIFEWYASGVGSSTIADRLNAEHVPAPRPAGWAQSGIRNMLRNEVYVGRLTWGRIKTVVRKGKEQNVPRPESEWVRVSAPELRIIDDALWQRAQAQREKRQRAFPRSPRSGRLLGRPSWRDGHSFYLWPGFGQCVCCQGSIRISHRKNGVARAVRRLYTCATRDERGPACANDITVLHERLDAALVAALTEVLDDQLLADAVDEAAARLRAHHATALDRRAQTEAALATTQQKIDRFVDALGDGSLPAEEIKRRLAPETARKQALASELATLADAGTVASLDAARIKRDLLDRVADVRTLFGTETQQSRALLRRLLVGPIVVEPFREPGRQGWRFTGTLSVARLLTGEAVTLAGSVGSGTARTGGDTSAASRGRAPRGCDCRAPGGASLR